MHEILIPCQKYLKTYVRAAETILDLLLGLFWKILIILITGQSGKNNFEKSLQAAVLG